MDPNKQTRQRLVRIVLTYTVFLIPAAAWYISVLPTWKNETIKGIFSLSPNHPALIDVLAGTIISKLPELLINYGSVLFFIGGFYFMFKNKLYHHRYYLPFIFWGVIIILYYIYEMGAIGLVHDYYLFPFLPAIFLLVAYGANHLLISHNSIKYLAYACLIILPITAFLRVNSRWDLKEPGFDPVFLKYKTELRNLIPQNVYCVVGNDPSGYILLYYLDRKGWTFDNNSIDENTLSYYISKGAGYLFVDSRIDTVAWVKARLDKKIFDKETLRGYKLK